MARPLLSAFVLVYGLYLCISFTKVVVNYNNRVQFEENRKNLLQILEEEDHHPEGFFSFAQQQDTSFPEHYRDILEANLFLTDKISIPPNVTDQIDGYSGVTVEFCALNWTLQKTQPHLMPRYGNFIRLSPECADTKVKVDLQEIVQLARRYDQSPSSKVHLLQESGFIFHESRCGSTLAANVLTVANPEQIRVYSEAKMLEKAYWSQNTFLVKDILYLLQRSNQPRERRVFYKLRSTATRYMQYLPNSNQVPWIYFYRHPHEVMASHFEPTEAAIVICLKSRKEQHPSEVREALKRGAESFADLTNEQVCAARLASLSQAAMDQHCHSGGSQGRFVNYNTLPESLWESILPDTFQLNMDELNFKAMKRVSGKYSKAWGEEINWNAKKEKKKVTLVQRMAASKFLMAQYRELEQLSNWTDPQSNREGRLSSVCND